MKTNMKYMLMAAAVATFSWGAVSCQEDAHNDLEGIYAAPSQLQITSASLSEKTKEGNLRTFNVALTTQEGTSVNLALVANQYYLAGNGYTLRDAASAKNGNYVSGASTINGSPVVDGTFNLVQNGDDYIVNTSILFTADGKAYKMKGGFTMSFEPDDPTAINILKGVVDNGNGTYSVTFSTGGYTEEFDMTTYQMVYAGEGNDLEIVFNLPDGKLHEGTYAPGTGYVAGYTFMNDAYEAWGVPAFEDYGGSRWYTIANGAKTTQIVTSGNIVVTKNGPLYTILLDQGKGGIFAQYTGAIADLDPDGGQGGSVVMMNNVLGVTNFAQMGWIGLIDIQLGNGSLVGTYDEATYSTTYSGSGDFLQIEVYGEQGVGTLERGTYEIADDASFGPMKFKVGAVGMYGDGGTFVKPYTDGVAGDAKFITEGTLTIEGEGDATKITLSTPDATYMFSGNIGL